jgi:hypothetical protein
MIKKSFRSTALSLKQQSADKILNLLTTTCLATGQYDAAVALQQAANYLRELNLIVDLISL